MQHARDDVYCCLVARRAVARAALHVGIADMTAEALDVLGDVLLEYISRMGRVMSHCVEAAGRSSAHANVLDAVSAAELCTASAVTHVHIPVRDENNNEEINNTSWKGLAAFLLGPDWYTDDKEGDYMAESSAAAGGKVGPISQAKAGWHAPYPNELPVFPVVQSPSLIANPHSFDREAVFEQLHSIVIEKPDINMDESETQRVGGEQDDTPDSAFQTWGILENKDNVKRKRGAVEDTDDDRPSKKSKPTETEATRDSTSDSACFLPSYYPPMPRAQARGRTVVVDSQQQQQQQQQTDVTASGIRPDPLLVRSSLVHLDHQDRSEQYWGTIVPNSGPVVMAGMTEKEAVQPQIIPLGRASGSRVSRILEGSMETGA